MQEQIITRQYLREHPDHVFVFGDNTERIGRGGAAQLRDEPNTYGFITKHTCSKSYTKEKYDYIYAQEINKLRLEIVNNPDKTFLITKVGAALANEFGIFESIIEPNIRIDLGDLKNVKFLW